MDYAGSMGPNHSYKSTLVILLITLGMALLVGGIAIGISVTVRTDFEKQDAYIQECLASGRYSREECVFMSEDSNGR